MKILITGGFGYLSNRLANDLSNFHHHIVLATRRKKILEYSSNKIEVKTIDWNSYQSIFDLCKNTDIVIHCAGVDAKTSIEKPQIAYDFNVNKTHDLVTAASISKIKKFIFLSTAHVYKAPLLGKISEASPTTNLHPYAKTRQNGELTVIRCCETGQMEGIVARLSNIYGAPESYDSNCWNLVINDFCKQAIFNKKIKVIDTFNSIRDFLPITSFLKVMRFIVESNHKIDPIVNIGSGFGQGVWDMARFIAIRCKALFGISVLTNIDRENEFKGYFQNFDNSCLEFSSKLDSVIDFKLIDQYYEVDNLLMYLNKIKQNN